MRQRFLTTLFSVFLLPTVLLFPRIVLATTVVDITSGDVGLSYNITWMDPTSSTGLSTNLSATGSFTVKSLTSSELLLGITLNNTTSSSFQAAILSLGMTSSPSLSGQLLGTSSVFSGLSDPGNFPGGFKNINLCLYAGSNCNGGDINNGLQSASSTSFELALTTSTGNLLTSGVDLSQFPVKFQTQDGSFELGDKVFPAAPEPSSFFLAGTGLLMILLFFRRTSRKRQFLL
ncbi:cistern family PEP-CTERM protein [Leptospirillum ferriphilum]|uniref:Ice-binding protein C-terminal domain-containing protein n=2 Tax=Leptospirillum TaxID=179 RepID=A0A094WF93_9BACT|nr:cistern family PEP-CTERM protein [Leptospirillum ferriphilum]EDZ38456.1 MAG: Hypothetical protein CGL2_10954009 [Leptospirillum sp. Group II '5-way CG']KGA94312.1 hypothetical protein LptCag_1075 [Leptospirillum ferriphilum]